MSVLGQTVLIGFIAIVSRFAWAEEPYRVPVVGQLWGGNSATAAPYDQAFRDGLRNFGYVNGKNIKFLARYANGDAARFPALINELIALRVDLVVVSPIAVRAAMQATSTVPIICATIDEPVNHGLVASLAHPGGNLTGLSTQSADTDPKKLELTRELVPGIRQVGLLFEANDPGWLADAEAFRSIAAHARVTLHKYGVRNIEDIRTALIAIDKAQPKALIVWNSSLVVLHWDIIRRFALAHRLPVISEGRNLAEAGALVTYSADFIDMYRRSAAYVDKIMKGIKPADLPIEQPNKFELIVNLKTAKLLGMSVPESILLRADEVIR